MGPAILNLDQPEATEVPISSYIHVASTRSFKPVNRPDPTQADLTRPDRDALWRLISRTLLKIRKLNFDTILNQVFNFYYTNLESIYFIICKPCASR